MTIFPREKAMTTQTYEDYQKQLTEIPQKIYYTWLSGFPSFKNHLKNRFCIEELAVIFKLGEFFGDGLDD